MDCNLDNGGGGRGTAAAQAAEDAFSCPPDCSFEPCMFLRFFDEAATTPFILIFKTSEAILVTVDEG